MNILSNDPRDVIRRQIKNALKVSGSQPTAQKTHIGPEDIPDSVKNPDNTQQLSPFASVFLGVMAFWTFIVKKFWWMVPAVAAVLFFTTAPEDLATMTQEGITVGTMVGTAFNYFLLGSFASLIPPIVIGNILKKGGTIQNTTVMLLQAPAFAMAGLTLWSLAAIIFLVAKSIGLG